MKSGMDDCTKIEVGRAVLELDWNNKMKGPAEAEYDTGKICK